MNKRLKEIKGRVYRFLVDKNRYICQDYNWYVNSNMKEHRSKPWKHWWVMFRLNLHYRIFRSKKPYFNGVGPRSSAQNAPFNAGPESGKRKWADAYHMAQSLLQYDVISFDIFDTLILRKLNNPTDLFAVVGGELGSIDFYNVRRKAEAEVRDIREEKNGDREPDIMDIYERVSYYMGIDPEKTARAEFETELNVCYANPYFQTVYRLLKAMGKTVVATSDMYLPKAWMKELLEHCGYDQLDEIYVSCDYKCSKSDGGLYQVLRSIYGEETNIVHLGDNFKTDVQMAREAGLEARHYVPCRGLGNQHRCEAMSPLIESAYRAVINNTLHNGEFQYSCAWEYGFTYGGLPTFGYMQWVHTHAVENGITKLLFLARDGFVMKKAFDLLFDDIETEYVYWSRSAAVRSVVDVERNYYLDHLLFRRKNSGETIGDALEICGILDFAPILLQNEIDLEAEITDENINQLTDIIVNNWEAVKTCMDKAMVYTREYLRKTVQGHQRVGIVDLGFSGRNNMVMKAVLEQSAGVNVEMYLIGNSLNRENADIMLRKDIQCYMFDHLNNPGIRTEVNNNGQFACGILERMYGATHPSFMGFTKEGNMEFAPVEAENNSKLLELQSGILDFCEFYKTAYKDLPEFYDITGWDAYRPIAMLIRSKNFVNASVGDLVQVFRVTNKDATSISKL